MLELSLNILDAVQNSIKAGATFIEIDIDEQPSQNKLVITIIDNGSGMTSEQLSAVTDPFYTTRKTRKVGLGVPFFKMAAELTGGHFDIQSEKGVGTKLCAALVYDSIDRMPLGQMNETIAALIQCNPDIDFLYRHSFIDKSFVLDTREVKQLLDGVSIDNAEVVLYLKDFITENEAEIKMQPE